MVRILWFVRIFENYYMVLPNTKCKNTLPLQKESVFSYPIFCFLFLAARIRFRSISMPFTRPIL